MTPAIRRALSPLHWYRVALYGPRIATAIWHLKRRVGCRMEIYRL